MRELLWQVLPASPAPQNPQNPFQHTAVLDPRTTTLAWFGRLGEQRGDLLPLRFGQQWTRPRHSSSFGAADPVYLLFSKTQPSSFQWLVQGCATASSKLCEFEIEQLRFVIQLHAGQMREQSDGHHEFYSIAQVSLQRFLFLPNSELDFLAQVTGIQSRSDERAPQATGPGCTCLP
jgi:hypothetical protein